MCFLIYCSNFSDYRWILDWWPGLLYSLIQCMTTLYSSLLHPHWCLQSQLHWHCLVAASSGGHSPSFGFPNCPRPQLPASHSNSSQQLNPSSYLTHSLTDQLTAKLLLALASTVILGSKSHGTHNHISMSDGSGSLQLTPQSRWFSLYSPSTNSTENSFSNSSSVVLCWFIAVEMCFGFHCLAMAIFSRCTIMSFSPHVKICTFSGMWDSVIW
jgi:hypothetical protein